jgi:hypothetical protein
MAGEFSFADPLIHILPVLLLGGNPPLPKMAEHFFHLTRF